MVRHKRWTHAANGLPCPASPGDRPQTVERQLCGCDPLNLIRLTPA
ncbi:hypothetical protein IL54_3529 [Sphingobium sp. ba1]|nr:hypothetical protein IL54_3529 [Sphingobium sp. ba1]